MSAAQTGPEAQGDLFEVKSRSKTYLANFLDQNTTAGNLDIYQVMHAAGQMETLLGIGAKINFKIAG